MAFFKKPKSDSAVRNQLKNLAREIGIETVRELKETGKELIGMRPEVKNPSKTPDKDWADEWLKNKDPDKPPVSNKIGEFSSINPKQQLEKNDQQELRQVQAKLNQLFSQPKDQSEQAKPIYDQSWKERQEKQQQQSQQRQAAPALGATGSARARGDWRHGAKRKRQPTPQELNRTEFRGSKGQ